MEKTKEEAILLNSRRTSELIGCSVQTLRNWHLSARVPVPIQLGNRLYWKRDEITRWLDANCPKRNDWIKIDKKFRHNAASNDSKMIFNKNG